MSDSPGRGIHITGKDRTTLGRLLRERYEGGASIRQLAEEIGRSYGFTQILLHEAGTALRGKAGTRGLDIDAEAH